jgi:hypothetical protein
MLNILFLVVEALLGGGAVYFGIQWYNNPDPTLEPLILVLTLVGGFMEWIRDQYVQKNNKPEDKTLAGLEQHVAALLDELRKTQPQSKETDSRATQAHEVPEAISAPPAPDELSTRIHSLVATRMKLIARLKHWAEIRRVHFDENEPIETARALKLPGPISGGVKQILEFTTEIGKKDPTDIRLSLWVDNMGIAVISFLDKVISDSKPAT